MSVIANLVLLRLHPSESVSEVEYIKYAIELNKMGEGGLQEEYQVIIYTCSFQNYVTWLEKRESANEIDGGILWLNIRLL